jgi:hypothetical protein
MCAFVPYRAPSGKGGKGSTLPFAKPPASARFLRAPTIPIGRKAFDFDARIHLTFGRRGAANGSLAMPKDGPSGERLGARALGERVYRYVSAASM